jgi:hypothetical protein
MTPIDKAAWLFDAEMRAAVERLAPRLAGLPAEAVLPLLEELPANIRTARARFLLAARAWLDAGDCGTLQ